MSILSRPLIADAVARLFASTVRPAAKSAVRFPEFTCRTTTVSVPTHHGPVTAAVYHPQTQAGDSSAAAVCANGVHGGGFVVGHPEQDDPWCRYLATHAGVAVINPTMCWHHDIVSPLRPNRSMTSSGGPPNPSGTGTARDCASAARAQGATSPPRPARPGQRWSGDFAASTALRPAGPGDSHR